MRGSHHRTGRGATGEGARARRRRRRWCWRGPSDGGAAQWTRGGWGAGTPSSHRSRPHGRTGPRPGPQNSPRTQPRAPGSRAAAASSPLPALSFLQPGRAPAGSGTEWLADGRAAGLILCLWSGFRRSRRGRQFRAMFYQPPSPSTDTGVSGLSPHHSACVGKMFPVPEGKKGLELVSMATERKRRPPQMDPARNNNTCSCSRNFSAQHCLSFCLSHTHLPKIWPSLT